MDMRVEILGLITEAEQQLGTAGWDLTPRDRALAREVAAGLGVVGPECGRADAVEPQRLERLREALAVLAIGLARTHGRLAWFLAGCSAALSPVLHWRALPAGDGPTFNTVVPTAEQFTQAEEAVRRLASMLARISA
ncbi:hypothetical protein [Kitasatospora sp. NPDC005748]|uniref:hypothetical protein n=1 Tax=Kitasatospora sp. NPDC005748 TaxID=3157063 RepID=UPI0033DBE2A0